MNNKFHKALAGTLSNFHSVLEEVARNKSNREKGLYSEGLIQLLALFSEMTDGVANATDTEQVEVILSQLKEEIIRIESDYVQKDDTAESFDDLDEDSSYMILPKKGIKFHA